MNYALMFARAGRVVKAAVCVLLAALILRTGYHQPPTDMVPEFICTITAFVLGLTGLAIGFCSDELRR